ncbi:MAG: hydrogenase expression/formation protein HypE, partial [Actinobacteria bacterium]|nr:hydrogenase expression/formation protein HypE [Actinomycetota bacterium]
MKNKLTNKKKKIKLLEKSDRSTIVLSHGDGGFKTSQLINEIIFRYIKNDILEKFEDSAVFNSLTKKIAFTTDSFVIDPIFFPGGDIGKLSICGTINDLVTSGCKPYALSLSLILEEGFPIEDLKKILKSIRETISEINNVKIVTGDTKVVGKGFVDKIYINTSGIGFIDREIEISPEKIRPGDIILINGTIAEHGIVILSQRKEFNFKTKLKSDCSPLNFLIEDMLSVSKDIHALRDATRGGVARILIELAESSKKDIEIYEKQIPIKRETDGICQFLGMDPLYIANEGKIIVFIAEKDAEKVLNVMRKNKYGKDSQIIGKVLRKGDGKVILNTKIGTP